MHYLKPNSTYKIHTIQIAVPEDIPISEVEDGINEMMNNGMDNEDRVYHDWQFFGEYGIGVKTDADPEEGEVFTT